MISKILVVDSDEQIVTTIKGILNDAGFLCVDCSTGKNALRKVSASSYDLIIAETELPDMSGSDLCHRLMCDESTARIPLIFVSRLSSEMDRVVGLSLGATDYVVKPFSTREFALRIKAILRKTSRQKPKSTLTNGVLMLDSRSQRVSVDSVPLKLTNLEFRLMSTLLSADGRVMTRNAIIHAVWGGDAVVLDRTVDAHIRTIRRKLGPGKGELETVQGVGYRIRRRAQE